MMTGAEYDAFHERVMVEQESCCHGHLGCSDIKGGPCSDEEFCNLNQAEQEERQS